MSLLRTLLPALAALAAAPFASATLTGTVIDWEVPQTTRGNDPIRTYWDPYTFQFSITQNELIIDQLAYLYGDQTYNPNTQFYAQIDVSVNGVVKKSETYAITAGRPAAPNISFVKTLVESDFAYGHNDVVYRLSYIGPAAPVGRYTTFYVEADVVRS